MTTYQVELRKASAGREFWDGTCTHIRDSECRVGIDAALKIATQVKLTPEIIESAIRAGQGAHMDIEKALVAALAALGFEVIE